MKSLKNLLQELDGKNYLITVSTLIDDELITKVHPSDNLDFSTASKMALTISGGLSYHYGNGNHKCGGICDHRSDCALHNMPAYPNEDCNCR